MKLRKLARVVRGLAVFAYHYRRYVFYSGWRERVGNPDERGYLLIKIAHSLEKSLSFKKRRPGGGGAAAQSLRHILRETREHPRKQYFDEVAAQTLAIFASVAASEDPTRTSGDAIWEGRPREVVGAVSRSAGQLRAGALSEPELFFHSRRSLREFSNESVDESVVRRALELAKATPSACNRQPWHVYMISEKTQIARCLALQNGNRGFGDKIGCLLVIAIDISAFGPGVESYQHWIDGGMYAMSVILALHSLGVASCCLNWSVSPSVDLSLRSVIKVPKPHSVIMMIGVGYPEEDNIVCASPRRPVSDYLTVIGPVQ